MEKWKYISGFNGAYMVSSYGRVKSGDRVSTHSNGVKEHSKGKELYQTTVNSGYKQVILYKDGKRHHRYVHQLVGNAFVDNPSGLTEINHKDYDKSNNNYRNLEWCTHLENIIDLRNKKYGIYKDSRNTNGTHKCVDCGKDITYLATRCIACSNKKTKYNHKNSSNLSKESIISALSKHKGNFTRASKEFGMTDNSLRKWCKKYGLPTHSKEWKN